LKAGETAMQNIKTSLRRGAFIVGAVMALAFFLLSCNPAIAHAATVGLKAKFDPVLEARIRGVLIGCRTKNVNPIVLQDDFEQLGNVRDASNRFNLSFWGKSNMSDPFCPQELSVVRVTECFGRYCASGLICQKSCRRSATIPNRKQDILAGFAVRLNDLQNVEFISEM